MMDARQENKVEIEKLLRQGESQATIARLFGLSRQRIQQIAKYLGLGRKHTKVAQEEEVLCERIVTYFQEGHSTQECKRQFNIPYYKIYLALEIAGINHVKEKERRLEEKYLPLVERVRNGESIRSIVNGSAYLARILAKYCDKHSVKSKHGRWNEVTRNRRTIIATERAAGKSWEAIATQLSKLEGRQLRRQAVYSWARHNYPELFE